MVFEVFDRSLSGRFQTPSATLHRRGVLSVNKAALSLIGSPEYVELYYDRARKVIGLRPVPQQTADAYALRKQVKGTGGSRNISLQAFVKYFDIDADSSRVFVPYLEDGFLCLDVLSGRLI